MQYFELTCIAYLKKDIIFKESFEKISKYISYSMAQDAKLKTIHKDIGFKYYTFGGFLPIEKEKIYLKGSSYRLTIRSIDENLIETLSKELRKNINNPNLIVVETNKKAVKQFFISELYSATPVIITTENGFHWTRDKDGDILKLQKQLQDNLEKKYQDFYSEKLTSSQNFIQLLEIKNQKPQTIQITKNGKKIRFFGNKFKIVPNEDEISQKLAFLALGCGLGEKGSFGGGFCLAKGMEL
jgi:CRISPR-associated endoribonuclease Cas6